MTSLYEAASGILLQEAKKEDIPLQLGMEHLEASRSNPVGHPDHHAQMAWYMHRMHQHFSYMAAKHPRSAKQFNDLANTALDVRNSFNLDAAGAGAPASRLPGATKSKS